MLKTLRTSPEGCLSDYRRDKLIANELSPEETSAARAHVATCARCAGRVTAARADAARFESEAPGWEEIARAAPATPAADGQPAPAAARGRRLIKRFQELSSLALGVVAIVMLVIGLRTPSGPDTRLKGSERVGFYVKRDGVTWAGKPGEVVRPGDAVRFTYSSQAPSFLAIVSADAGGNVQILYPEGGQSAQAPAGREVALPESTVLDDAIGHERILTLFCEHAVALEPLRRAWQASSGLGEPPVPAGCHADVVTWEKRAP